MRHRNRVRIGTDMLRPMHTRIVPLLILAACTGPTRDAHDPTPLLGVDATESWSLDGLTAPVQVIRTEGNVPHVYATTDADLARVEGFEMARDRFFVMDLARRLSLGEISELLGDIALESDIASRASGTRFVADEIDRTMPDDARARAQAFADGVNAYIDAVAAGQLPAPSEYDIAAPLLGTTDPSDLMRPFGVHDVAAIGATLTYNLGYETGDVGNEVAWEQLQTDLYGGQALGDLRQAGVLDDIWLRMDPVKPTVSAPERNGRSPKLPDAMAHRLVGRLKAMQDRMGRDHEAGWGSNAWAVAGTATTDGRALVAGDGHLPLSVPALFWQVGRDTALLGGGDTTQIGLAFPGVPDMAVGTNGRVGWSQTQLMGDITDWYREELELDDAGLPVASRFDGASQPLIAVDETYTVANVPILGSVGRTETWTRWTTFDGRWIADIEGRDATADEVLADGESLVNMGGKLVVPQDLDGDGIITGVSFDYTGLDDGNLLRATNAFGHAGTVEEFDDATRALQAYSQNMAVADSTGSILYTGYQPVPCRGYLERDGDGRWTDGSDPSRLLDGTKYGGFSIPYGADGLVDESQASDPYSCVVPFDVYPRAIDPDQGFVVTANNDPAGWSLDGELFDDEWYIGGPWIEGYRAETIAERLQSSIADNSADLDAMQSIQADTHSSLGEDLVPEILASIDAAKAASEAGDPPDAATARLAALYDEDPTAYDEVRDRLAAWQANGVPTPSGVETFYHHVADGEVDDAVATSIFNSWLGRYTAHLFDDEHFPDVFKPTGGTGRMRTVMLMLNGRGPGNPLGLASWNPDTEESAFFDVLGTDEVETSPEIAMLAMRDGLAFLRSPSTAPGEGGFGTDEMSQWIWGLRHWVHFDSLLGDYIPADSGFGAIVDQFAITPEDLPLAEGITSDDPRHGMKGFPRQGDNFSVDAGNSGFGTDFQYGSGPVFRMVIALGPDGVEGRNILPGGQSGLVDSPYRADQAALWLANETWPMRFTVDEVLDGAIGREQFTPTEPPL
jgi:penicillin amidase